MWGIGYVSSDWKEDRDDMEYLYDEDDLFEEAELLRKIRAGSQLSPHEMETVGASTRLRDVYNTRWWNPTMNSFFVQYNHSGKPMKAGEQAFNSYGNRGDDCLIESYGFCFEPGQNPFSSWKFRVLIGVNPAGEIEDVSELIPSKEVLDD